MNPEQLTIVIPTVNRLPLLRRALESAIAQTAPVQILVSDNGSNDGTEDFLAQCSHPRLTKKRIEETISAQDHASRLHQWVETEWAVFLSDDDYLEPEFAARIAAHHDGHPECTIVYTSAWVHIWDSCYAGKAGPAVEEGSIFMLEFLQGNREPCWCAIAVRMEDMRRIGPQPPDRQIGDMYYWIRILTTGMIGCVAEPLAHYLYASDKVKNTTSGIRLRDWYRECILQAEEMIHAQPEGMVGLRPLPVGGLRRIKTRFIARSCANQIIWNRIRGSGRWALASDSFQCARVFLTMPIVWPRVLAGLLLPKHWIRALVKWYVENLLASTVRRQR